VGVYTDQSVNLPTAAGTQTAVATGAPLNSPYDFAFFDMDGSGTFTNNDRLYVVDDGAVGARSMQRFTYNGTNWTTNPVQQIASGVSDVRSLTGVVVNSSTVTLYATRATNNIPTSGAPSFATSVVTLTDNGSAGTATTWNDLTTA